MKKVYDEIFLAYSYGRITFEEMKEKLREANEKRR